MFTKQLINLLVVILFFSLTISPTIAASTTLTQAENTTVFLVGDIYVNSQLDGGISFEKHEYNQPYCSGFVYQISSEGHGTYQYILSAKHCIDGFSGKEAKVIVTPKEVHYFNGDVGTIISTWVSPNQDIGLLLVHTMRAEKEHVNFTNHVGRGEPLYVMGMPHGYFWSYSPATALMGSEFQNTPFGKLLQIECASCYNGDSGAAVYDNHGNVIGLVDASGEYPNIFLISTTKQIQYFLTYANL